MLRDKYDVILTIPPRMSQTLIFFTFVNRLLLVEIEDSQ